MRDITDPSDRTCAQVVSRADSAPRFGVLAGRFVCLAALLSVFHVVPSAAQEWVLAGRGASMTYLANATDPGVGLDWIQPGFDDSSWQIGAYGVGYETASTTGAEHLIETQVPPGTLSVYTRVVISIDNAAEVHNLALGVDYDDGYVAWLNGVEVFRSPEMPAGSPAWDTASSPHESSNGFVPRYEPLQDISAAGLPALQSGTNVLAIGVWNHTATSSELVLVPQITINRSLSVTRGPYLQMGTDSGITVRWRTDVPQTSRVDYGATPDSLVNTVRETLQETTEHSVTLDGLTPDTRYYYAVGNDAELLVGADERHTFITAPPPNSPRPIRMWVLGDSGTANINSARVRDAYLALGETTHLWLMLGDNAYPSGTDEQYQQAVFDHYPSMLRSAVLWPSLGNHDTGSSDSPSQTGPYFEAFDLPIGGEAGGLPSGTEAYYSFDYGNVHFVVLDSADSDRSAASPMLTWLAQDLAASVADWTIAFWHHPPYSEGSHLSDFELPLIEMRENALPILENHGVDLVLTGHSHSYERSFLIDGHYGDSTTFGPQHVLDGGDGTEAGDGIYRKADLGPGPHQGAVYTVAGNSGSVRGGPLAHPAMFESWNVLGSLVLDVEGNRLDSRMLSLSGDVLDSFTLVKGPYCATGPDADFDGVCDDVDNCPDDPNTEQLDSDADGIGDVCDACVDDPGNDPDGDGRCYAVDNCPLLSNPGQQDGDGDGFGDPCDACPSDAENDADSDAVCGDLDNCPQFNPCQRDSDNDGVGDVCDSSSERDCNVFAQQDSWLERNSPWAEHGHDEQLRSTSASSALKRPIFRFGLSSIPAGAGIVFAHAYFFVDEGASGSVNLHRMTDDWNEQNANWNNTSDDFDPSVEGAFHPADDEEWVGVDLTSLAQSWIDGSRANQGIMFQSSSGSQSRYASREWEDGEARPCMHVLYECLTPETDADGDGTPDITDGCPNDPDKSEPGICGCHVLDTDSDGDGAFDCDDLCPADPAKVVPGSCGCGAPETDADGDGTADCVDECVHDPDDDVDADGLCADLDNCPAVANVAQFDADGDGRGDPCDACPDGQDGDGDGVCDYLDSCPANANPSQADSDGDGRGDLCDPCALDADDDFDNDGVCGDEDNCPGTFNPGQADWNGDGVGQACDDEYDLDADGVPDAADNCPNDSNPAQQDLDGDAVGDLCDADDDGDGVADVADCAANRPGVAAVPGSIGPTLMLGKTDGGTLLSWSRSAQGHVSNVYRGLGGSGAPPTGLLDCAGVARPVPESVQPDVPPVGAYFYFLVGAANICGESGLGTASDGIERSALPACPTVNRDGDADGVPDSSDNCPTVPNASQADLDGDFTGDACES